MPIEAIAKDGFVLSSVVANIFPMEDKDITDGDVILKTNQDARLLLARKIGEVKPTRASFSSSNPDVVAADWEKVTVNGGNIFITSRLEINNILFQFVTDSSSDNKEKKFTISGMIKR